MADESSCVQLLRSAGNLSVFAADPYYHGPLGLSGSPLADRDLGEAKAGPGSGKSIIISRKDLESVLKSSLTLKSGNPGFSGHSV